MKAKIHSILLADWRWGTEGGTENSQFSGLSILMGEETFTDQLDYKGKEQIRRYIKHFVLTILGLRGQSDSQVELSGNIWICLAGEINLGVISI